MCKSEIERKRGRSTLLLTPPTIKVAEYVKREKGKGEYVWYVCVCGMGVVGIIKGVSLSIHWTLKEDGFCSALSSLLSHFAHFGYSYNCGTYSYIHADMCSTPYRGVHQIKFIKKYWTQQCHHVRVQFSLYATHLKKIGSTEYMFYRICTTLQSKNQSHTSWSLFSFFRGKPRTRN